MILRRLLLRKPLSPKPKIPNNPRRIRNSSSSSTTKPPTTYQRRLTTLHSKLPRFLHPYTRGLLNAPITHIISFLILHELTAIVPLIGLASLFHYSEWTPVPGSWIEGKWVREGVERFGSWFGRKGWFGVERVGVEGVDGVGEGVIEGGEGKKRWITGEKGGRILVEVASAYAITKVFLPARILLSVWGTPWFARVFVGRFMGLFKGVKGSGSVSMVNGLGASAGGIGGGGGVAKKVVESGKNIPP